VPKTENIAPKMNTNDVDLSEKQQSIAVETEISSDDDLALGASASPTEEPSNSPPALPALFDTAPDSSDTYRKPTTFSRFTDYETKSKFVGLVNQAMTCYLNSLLQALFMTPEFRNALYNWESDGSTESKNIPFQLQKLFINLQTSNKPAVETTDLTKSFGWDSTEAWQQHDIQELCRVMFDALEQKFKNTKQADLINNLYEGKMIDYVKCLECDTEKSREDTFLDIPLPVKPFGATVAYESIEEALKGFVQPETLDGNNQYFCEKCNKKCDAHKGLKFKKFPYILTLHLKRFDFDYSTLHRIKLNDKVTFPQQLNLNGFVTNNSMEQNSAAAVTSKPNDQASVGSVESAVKCDDYSTTDSVLDEEGSQYNQNSTHLPSETQEDDEGIDMSVNGDCKSLMSNSTSIDSSNNGGPYNYDLFAIMIHSGSASGGHYYAYIKDLETGSWHSFNDQTVSPITQEDICKSFGGSGAFKSYYSGFSSSTNAYMLMYRQQDPARNCLAIK
jgi:ubiquitin carboxyl-terminal hydrolase 47